MSKAEAMAVLFLFPVYSVIGWAIYDCHEYGVKGWKRYIFTLPLGPIAWILEFVKWCQR